MKKYLPIILLLIASLMLPSCVGIGDGAMFDNITTSEPKDITLEAEDGIVCKLVAYYDESNEIMDEATVEGAEAEAIYEYLTDSSNYTNVVEEVAMSHSYIRVTFEGIEDTEEYTVRSSDNVDITDVLLLWGRTGHLEGAYDKLFGYIAEKGSSGGFFCNIHTSDTPHAFVRASGWQVRDIYLLLSELELPTYDTSIPRTAEEKSYVILGFYGAVDATYYVYSDDYVEEFNSYPSTNASMFNALGFLDGIYEQVMQLYINTLNMPTEAENMAGVKLNCLQVTVDNMLSRAYHASDFVDVGCTFLYAVDGDKYWVYFESCSEAELQNKIAVLKQIEGIKEANVIPVILYGAETAHEA